MHTLNEKEIYKFLAIQKIKFVSNTKPTKKESFILLGLIDCPLFMSDDDFEQNFSIWFNAWNDIGGFYKKVAQTFLSRKNVNPKNKKAIRKHLYYFSILGCNYL